MAVAVDEERKALISSLSNKKDSTDERSALISSIAKAKPTPRTPEVADAQGTDSALVDQTGDRRYAKVAQYEPFILKHAERTGLPPAYLRAMLLTEGDSNISKDSKNPFSSASGPMQYIRSTAKRKGINPRDPDQAIGAAADDFKHILDRYGGDPEKAIAAHHEGEPSLIRKLDSADATGQTWHDFLSPEGVTHLKRFKNYYANLSGEDMPSEAQAQSIVQGRTGNEQYVIPESDPNLTTAQNQHRLDVVNRANKLFNNPEAQQAATAAGIKQTFADQPLSTRILQGMHEGASHLNPMTALARMAPDYQKQPGSPSARIIDQANQESNTFNQVASPLMQASTVLPDIAAGAVTGGIASEVFAPRIASSTLGMLAKVAPKLANNPIAAQLVKAGAQGLAQGTGSAAVHQYENLNQGGSVHPISAMEEALAGLAFNTTLAGVGMKLSKVGANKAAEFFNSTPAEATAAMQTPGVVKVVGNSQPKLETRLAGAVEDAKNEIKIQMKAASEKPAPMDRPAPTEAPPKQNNRMNVDNAPPTSGPTPTNIDMSPNVEHTVPAEEVVKNAAKRKSQASQKGALKVFKGGEYTIENGSDLPTNDEGTLGKMVDGSEKRAHIKGQYFHSARNLIHEVVANAAYPAPSTITKLARDREGAIIGGIMYTPNPHLKEIEVDFLGSLRQGVGTDLLNQAEDAAAKRGYSLRLKALPDAQSYYEHRGFEQTNKLTPEQSANYATAKGSNQGLEDITYSKAYKGAIQAGETKSAATFEAEDAVQRMQAIQNSTEDNLNREGVRKGWQSGDPKLKDIARKLTVKQVARAQNWPSREGLPKMYKETATKPAKTWGTTNESKPNVYAVRDRNDREAGFLGFGSKKAASGKPATAAQKMVPSRKIAMIVPLKRARDAIEAESMSPTARQDLSKTYSDAIDAIDTFAKEARDRPTASKIRAQMTVEDAHGFLQSIKKVAPETEKQMSNGYRKAAGVLSEEILKEIKTTAPDAYKALQNHDLLEGALNALKNKPKGGTSRNLGQFLNSIPLSPRYLSTKAIKTAIKLPFAIAGFPINSLLSTPGGIKILSEVGRGLSNPGVKSAVLGQLGRSAQYEETKK